MQSKIADLVDQCLSGVDDDDCFVIEIKSSAKGAIQVFLDADEGITLERCKKISRCLEASLDEAGLYGGKYSLEVSSPGAERPLTMLRQYPKHLGRTLEVKLKDGSRVEGRLESVNNAKLVVASSNGEDSTAELTWEEIDESIVQLRFKK